MSPHVGQRIFAAVAGVSLIAAGVIWWISNHPATQDGTGNTSQQATSAPTGDSVDPRLFLSSPRPAPTQSIFGSSDVARTSPTAFSPHLDPIDVEIGSRKADSPGKVDPKSVDGSH